jgi:hypothetical protein
MSSLNRDAYFYYRHRPRPPWEYPTALVFFVVLAVAAETAVGYAVFAKRRAVPLWMPASLALLVLAPWGMFLSLWVVHAPGFWLLHLLWVWLLIGALLVTAVLSASVNGYRSFRARGRVRAVEK